MKKGNYLTIILIFLILAIILFTFTFPKNPKTKDQQIISAQAVRGGCSLTLDGDVHCVDISTSIEGASCSDDTVDDSCSLKKPLYCSNGNLYEFCAKCGCDQGSECISGRCVPMTCENVNGLCQTSCGEGYINFRLLGDTCELSRDSCGDGICSSSESCSSCSSDCGSCQQACADGTLYGNCNQERTRYCSEGTLVEDCRVNCPACPSSYTCNPADGLCVSQGASGNETSFCGDSFCSEEEDCEICPDDCLSQGQICCSGTSLYGTCCSSLECPSGQRCINNQCCNAECSSDQECDTIYPEVAPLRCVGAGQCNSYCGFFSDVGGGGSPSTMKIIGQVVRETKTCCIKREQYSKIFQRYMGYVCADGTLYDSCSRIKPYYCDKGTLIQDCGRCGCFYGICQDDKTCKVDERTLRLLQASPFARQTDIGARLLGDKLVVPSILTRPRTEIKDNKTQLAISGVELTFGIDRERREPELRLNITP